MNELNKIINEAQDKTLKNLNEINKILDSMAPPMKTEIPDHDCHNVPATVEGHCDVCSKYDQEQKNNKCEFCSSWETTKYPAEGGGDVYLCEGCPSIDK